MLFVLEAILKIKKKKMHGKYQVALFGGRVATLSWLVFLFGRSLPGFSSQYPCLFLWYLSSDELGFSRDARGLADNSLPSQRELFPENKTRLPGDVLTFILGFQYVVVG